MKRHRGVPVLSALLLVGTGCAAFSDDTGGSVASDGDGDGDGTVSVATAFYALQFVTERVGGDLVDVQNLTSPGQEPHDLELSVQQTAAITDADLVVVEAALQPGVADAVEQSAVGTVLEVADVVDLAESSRGGHEDGAGDQPAVEGRVDPHFWQDPALLADVAAAVADRLSEISPDDADDFGARAAALGDDLAALDTAYAEGLAGCERDTVVVSHDAFGYLERYGLDLHPITGLSPDAEPVPAVLAELQDLIADDAVTTVFSEALASPRLAAGLAGDAEVTTAVLDPVEGLTDRTADQDYLSLMQQNLTALETANGC